MRCLLFFFLLTGCSKSLPVLSGPVLLDSIRAYLSNPSDSVTFDADYTETRTALDTLLAQGRTGRSGQDTLSLACIDGKQRALGVHAPLSYTPDHPLPVVLWLHGGVNGTKPNRGAEVAHYFARESDSLYFLFAAPSGERGATWYDPVGITFIRDAVAEIKRRYAVDDNRVMLAGVSDGGTGCVAAANLIPAPFAGYIVCSGFPPMLSAFGLPCFIENLRRAPWLFVHSGKDPLYPGDTVKALMERWTREGVPITFHYYPDMPHGLDYMPQEKPAVMDFISRTRRSGSPDTIEMRVLFPQRYAWVSVDSLTTAPVSLQAVRNGKSVIVRTEGAGRFSLYPDSDWTTPGDTLSITVNGTLLPPAIVRPSARFLLTFVKKEGDAGSAPLCQLSFAVR
ncbi:MAG: hypothetical protein V1913_09560 [Fibrobacterota bacterium]